MHVSSNSQFTCWYILLAVVHLHRVGAARLLQLQVYAQTVAYICSRTVMGVDAIGRHVGERLPAKSKLRDIEYVHKQQQQQQANN